MHEPDIFEQHKQLYKDDSIYRRLRIAGGTQPRSLCITLPKKFLVKIGVKNGDFLKITSKDEHMIIEKPNVNEVFD